MIAITRTDGGVSIMHFDSSDAEVDAEIARAGIDALRWRRVAPEDLPPDRTDRNAWADNGKTIAVDPVRKAGLDQAKAEVRDPLAELDALKAALIIKDML